MNLKCLILTRVNKKPWLIFFLLPVLLPRHSCQVSWQSAMTHKLLLCADKPKFKVRHMTHTDLLIVFKNLLLGKKGMAPQFCSHWGQLFSLSYWGCTVLDSDLALTNLLFCEDFIFRHTVHDNLSSCQMAVLSSCSEFL